MSSRVKTRPKEGRQLELLTTVKSLMCNQKVTSAFKVEGKRK